LEDGYRVIKHDEWVSSHQVPAEANGKQWRGFTFFKLKSGHSGQHDGIPEGDEHGDEIEDMGEIQLDPSSMATSSGALSLSSKGKGTSSMASAKAALASSSTEAKGYQLEDGIPGGKGFESSIQQIPKGKKGKPKGNYLKNQQKGFYLNWNMGWGW
jgi:hypothetical protein